MPTLYPGEWKRFVEKKGKKKKLISCRILVYDWATMRTLSWTSWSQSYRSFLRLVSKEKKRRENAEKKKQAQQKLREVLMKTWALVFKQRKWRNKLILPTIPRLFSFCHLVKTTARSSVLPECLIKPVSNLPALNNLFRVIFGVDFGLLNFNALLVLYNKYAKA